MPYSITYQDIFDNTSNGVIVTDENGAIVLINQQAEKILNLEANAHANQPVFNILPLTGAKILECMETKKPILGHQIIGKTTNLVLNITPIIKNKIIRGAVCNFQELSVFENSARRLESYKRLNRQLETIIHASSDGIWVCDEKGEVVHINEASQKLNGICAEDVVGKNVFELVKSGMFDQSVTLMVLKSKKQESILQYIRQTGKTLLLTGTPAFDEKGDIFLVVVNERDITDLNALRDQIEQNRKIAEKYREELADLSMLELKKHDIIAESKKMRHLLSISLKLSRMNASNILITGESGTGKGLLAKFIHKSSTRHKNPFVQINCAALPESLLEAELFGYEKGAFTGAGEKGKVGLFEVAQNGTLFLDEIGDMPLPLQAKLLTYLDNNEIRRLGGTESVSVECAIIAATNQHIELLVKQKKFREDLYFRLNSFVLHIPPLRERPEDIFELVEYYLEKYNNMYSTQKKIGAPVIHLLQSHPFPGNVRELKSMIKKAVILSDHAMIDSVIETALSVHPHPVASRENADSALTGHLQDQLEILEKELLLNALKHCKTTREIANVLGVSQPTIVRKMKKHRLQCKAFPS